MTTDASVRVPHAPSALVAAITSALGKDADDVIARAHSDDNKLRLRQQCDEAIERGIFGAPSFVTEDGELFWGNDRIEDALDWAVRGTLRPNSQN